MAARGGGVRRGCGHDGCGGPADGDQGQDHERRVEERTARAVGERAPRAADGEDDQRGEQQRPDPTRDVERATRRHEADDDSGEHGGEAGNERPRLGLSGEAGRCDCEQRESGAEGDEGAAGDPRLVRSREDGEYEHEAEGEPGGDRGEHDEAYVALRGGLLSGRGAAAGGNGLGGHFDSSLDIGQ